MERIKKIIRNKKVFIFSTIIAGIILITIAFFIFPDFNGVEISKLSKAPQWTQVVGNSISVPACSSSSVDSVSCTSASISWSEQDHNCTDSRIFLNGLEYARSTCDGSLTFTGLSQDTIYDYSIEFYDINSLLIFADSINSSFTTGICIPPPPSGLSQQCPSPGTSADVSWGSVTGATYYALRADNQKNSWNGLCDGSQNSGDICENINAPTVSKNFSSDPGQTYGWWVHACNSAGCSAPTSGSSFTCVAMVQPNLLTQSLSVSPSSPISGDLINFSGVIKNTGTANAGVSTSRLRFDIGNNGSYEYTWTNSTGALDTGAQETEIWADIPVSTTGTHGYEICADSASAVTESSESDNCATATFTVSAALTPDLLTDTLSVTPSSPVSGDLVDFSGIIRNSGSATAGASTARLRFDVGNNG